MKTLFDNYNQPSIKMDIKVSVFQLRQLQQYGGIVGMFPDKVLFHLLNRVLSMDTNLDYLLSINPDQPTLPGIVDDPKEGEKIE